jgi:rhamnulokinase
MTDSSSKKYLTFDFGAESGRAILGSADSGVITIQEIHRFENKPLKCDNALRWNVPQLWDEVRKALSRVEDVALSGIGVDAWGVDYALLDAQGELLENPYHYRDNRTRGTMESVFKVVPKDEIYRTTGIQFMPINTLYQLFAAKRDTPELLKAAKTLLTIPDLFHYWLTGNAVCEFTNATTTQMVNASTRTWARDLIDRLELPLELPAEIVEPGTVIGKLQSKVSKRLGQPVINVIAPASHDTASAVAAITARDDTAFLSSGTWSLIGTEVDAPIITTDALRLNFTNEGGVGGNTLFLKNVMGLWMLQCCRQSWSSQGRGFDYEELLKLVTNEQAFAHLVDPDDESFLHPMDMPEAIDQFCSRTDQPTPKTLGAYVRTILESLAFKYRLIIESLAELIGRPIEQIRVVGGGAKNRLLNQFTADATGRRVLAGPVEATSLGNVAVQILATGGAGSLREVRSMIQRSFPVEIFEPVESHKWNDHAERFKQYGKTGV